MKSKYEFEIKLSNKQNEAEIRLRDQMIESLQQKIQEMQAQLKARRYFPHLERISCRMKAR